MDTNSMSPADFSALMGNNGQFGGNGAWWLILLFLFFMNGGFNRNGDYGQYATAASQQDILFGQKFSALDNKIDRVANGIADATYALNNGINNVQTYLGSAITTQGRSIQGQLADIGCANRLATAQIAAQMDRQTGILTNAIRDEGAQTRALIQTNEIQALRDKVQSLEADTRMCGVVRYPMSYAYSAGPSPFCNCACNCNGNI